jgi:DNA-directed RNA polymerase
VNVAVGSLTEINGRDAAQAAAANFTHSCDAAHLQMLALAAAKEGIQMVPVHDCFGCLAPRARRFKEIINKQFFDLHEHHNMLVGLRASAEKLIKGELPKFPDFGPAKRADVLTSRHAFK